MDSFSNLSKMIDMIGKEKGIDKDLVIDAVKQGLLVAARKKYGTYREIEAQYNEESGEVELYQFKEVVTDDDFIDDEVEIKLSEAIELDPDAQLNDSIGSKLETGDLGRIAAQMAKQIITQKVRDAEKDIIFKEFESRKGDIASGISRRVERRAIVVDLGRIEAYIPPQEQIPGEMFKPGDRVQGYLKEVRQTTRGPQVIMSRADENYLKKLFEIEVPEVYEGIVEIVSAAREPGSRAKIAVYTKDSAVDPVGACVGMKGSRVQNIVQELSGEKIDIVNWDEEPAKFVCNALAPSEISKVYMDEARQSMEVVVPDHQLSLAIGKRGQNVRLAAKLTGWRLDIVSETNSALKTAEAIFNLMLIPEMGETMAQNIFQSGFSSFQDIADAPLTDLMGIPGYEEEEKAQELLDKTQKLVDDFEGKEVPTIEAVKEPVKAPVSSKLNADERLMEELAQLDSKEANDGSVEEPSGTESGEVVSDDKSEAAEAADIEADSSEENVEGKEAVEAAAPDQVEVESGMPVGEQQDSAEEKDVEKADG